jgi:hypothetical protein
VQPLIATHENDGVQPGARHWPFVQVWPLLQALPQAPQLWLSLLVSTNWPEQHVPPLLAVPSMTLPQVVFDWT